jgi:hypothetical protein
VLNKASNPRAHHYVPQCWLCGFTEGRENTSRIWQSALKSKNQWPTTPANAGHRRDFYRLTDANIDPVLIEKRLSEIEDAIAPLFKQLDSELRMPDKDELENRIVFMAIQWIRVPAFRPLALGIAEELLRSKISTALNTPESWNQLLRDADIPIGSPGSDSLRMREFIESDQYSFNAPNDWYIMRGFNSLTAVIDSLSKRSWRICIDEHGDFIGSDNPIVMDGPMSERIGFENAEVIIYPISRHLVIYGTKSLVRTVDRLDVARHNTFMMLTASDYVFSYRPDFIWLDENDQYQNNFSLFDKEKFVSKLRSISGC